MSKAIAPSTQHSLERAEEILARQTSLTPRLVALARQVGTVQHPGQPLRYDLSERAMREFMELDRTEAQRRLQSLTSALDPEAPFVVDDVEYPGAQAKGALLTRMILGLAKAASISAEESDSKLWLYEMAIEGIPAAAVALAIRRWAQSRCPESIEHEPRYAFPPSPATLRAMALFDLEGPQRDAELLKNLLAAVTTRRAMDPEPLPVEVHALPALRRM